MKQMDLITTVPKLSIVYKLITNLKMKSADLFSKQTIITLV